MSNAGVFGCCAFDKGPQAMPTKAERKALVEITPEMVTAGARVIESYEPNGMLTCVAEERAMEVFRAMIAANSGSLSDGPSQGATPADSGF